MKKIAWVLSVLVFFAAGLYVGRLDQSQIGAAFISAAVDDHSLAIGAKAPPFDLPGVDDKNYRLDDFKNAKVLAVVFTCNHCPTAQAYEARIKELASNYAASDVAVVAISTNDPQAITLDELGYSDLNDSFADMKIRARDHQFNFPYLYDGAAQQVGHAYGPLATPHVFIFDNERTLRYKGRFDNSENPRHVQTNDARNAIDAILAGHNVAVAQTRVFGCSIKWSDKRANAEEKRAKWQQQPVSVQPLQAADVRRLILSEPKKWRLVNVWATWCTPCRDEFPHLVEMQQMYGGRDVEVVTISLDNTDATAQVKSFLETNHAAMTNYQFISADQNALAEVLDPGWQGAVPYTALVAPGGTVVYRQHGQFDALTLKRNIVDRIGRTYF